VEKVAANRTGIRNGWTMKKNSTVVPNSTARKK
jgi:hypothetical protein